MEGPLRADRAFEHSLHRARRKGAPPGGQGTRYDMLMRVSFRHSYYNRSGDACTDLSARPTAAARRLMHSLGLLFRDEGTGFSILYDTKRTDNLISYLRRQSERINGSGPQYWTRLSFVLAARSAYFISVTDIPIDLNSIQRNFYFSNQSAHVEPNGTIILNPDAEVSADELLPVIPPQYPVPVSDDVLGVEVRAISGEVVLCEPRCLPAPPAQEPPAARCGEWLETLPQGPPNRCRDVIQLDFSSLPEDKYSIAYVFADGAASAPGAYLYTGETPTPLAFVDLLFSAPTAQAYGFYPVQGLSAETTATIVPVDYVLNFEARATVWNYYIVPQPRHDAFDQLSIDSTPPGPQVRFAGPCCVVLPNGAKAYRFVSERPLRLQQESPFRLRLRGRRSDRSLDDDVLIDRLPVAGNQVLPQTSVMARLGLANSLCPDAEDGAGCPNLIRHFFGGSRVSAADAVERMRQLRSEAKKTVPTRPPPSRGAVVRTRSYSDIYVYV